MYVYICMHAQQCWKVGVINKISPELDCCVYQGLLEAYHLWGAATRVTGFENSKGRCSLTCFVD